MLSVLEQQLQALISIMVMKYGCYAEVQHITFTIYNKNTLTDNTVIGTASYPLAQSISTGFEESRVPVTTPEGTIQGSLHIRAAFHTSYTV